MTLAILILEFFKTGLLAVGGGLATIPFLYEMAANYRWVGPAEIADIVAVSSSLPGPIGVSMSVYVGYRAAGFAGALAAPIGLTAPSILVIILIARALREFKENPIVQSIFGGLRPAATGLLAAAGFSVAIIALLRPDAVNLFSSLKLPEIMLFIVVFAAIRIFKWHPVFYIAASAGIGYLFSW